MHPTVVVLLVMLGGAASLSEPLDRSRRTELNPVPGESQTGAGCKREVTTNAKRSDFTHTENQLPSGSQGGGGGSCGESLVALETMVQQQAATIQDLMARLTATDTALQLLGQRVEQQGSSLVNMSMGGLTHGASQGNSVGFYADFGKEPFDDVTIAPNDTAKFNRVLTNEGAAYNETTGLFTAPVSGLYTFSLHFMGGRHTGNTNLAITAGSNHTLAVAYSDGTGRDSNDQGSCTAVAQLVKGEEVGVRVEFGNSMIWGSSVTSFSGLLVQPTPP